MKDLIKGIKRTTRLYRQPSRIGDILEVDHEHWLVIGFQNVQIIYGQLEITYVCQNLERDFIAQPTTNKGDEFRQFEMTIKTGKEANLERIQLGKIFWYGNMPFQSIAYTDVEIKFTDVVVSVLARPIRPIARKEAKAKLLDERKKKINLTLV